MFKNLKGRLKIVQELFTFLWENKIWWMSPIIIVLLLVGILIIFTVNNPAAVPFIYTLF
ncbi:MAG: hypothetical protein KAS13_05350 [Candidatus Omnitrophica bacterium]|nr:hypothetical protein [Candidatus Omnitrophota bacterium]